MVSQSADRAVVAVVAVVVFVGKIFESFLLDESWMKMGIPNSWVYIPACCRQQSIAAWAVFYFDVEIGFGLYFAADVMSPRHFQERHQVPTIRQQKERKRLVESQRAFGFDVAGVETIEMIEGRLVFVWVVAAVAVFVAAVVVAAVVVAA